MYNYISATVRVGMASTFDEQILIEKAENNYYHSKEYIDTFPDEIDNDYDLEYENGTTVHLKAERYK